jgi:hypothetical protein
MVQRKEFAGLNCLDDFAETEGAAVFGELVGQLVAMELESGQAGLSGESRKRVGGFVGDDTDLFDGGWQGGDDFRGIIGCDLTLAGSEDEAQGVSAGVEAGESVVESRVRADFYADHRNSFEFLVLSFKLK